MFKFVQLTPVYFDKIQTSIPRCLLCSYCPGIQLNPDVSVLSSNAVYSRFLSTNKVPHILIFKKGNQVQSQRASQSTIRPLKSRFKTHNFFDTKSQVDLWTSKTYTQSLDGNDIWFIYNMVGTENISKLQIASCSVIYSLNQNLYKKNIPAVMQSIIQLPECFAFKQRYSGRSHSDASPSFCFFFFFFFLALSETCSTKTSCQTLDLVYTNCQVKKEFNIKPKQAFQIMWFKTKRGCSWPTINHKEY